MAPPSGVACPPPCAPHREFYVVVAWDTDRGALFEKAKALAPQLRAEFPEGLHPADANACGARTDCLRIVDSLSDGTRQIFALTFLVGRGYRDAKKPAEARLRKARAVVKDAYLEPVQLCVCG